MTSDHIAHDVAWSTALALADSVNWHREEDHREAFRLFYECVREAIDQWRLLKQQENKRLLKGPSEN